MSHCSIKMPTVQPQWSTVPSQRSLEPLLCPLFHCNHNTPVFDHNATQSYHNVPSYLMSHQTYLHCAITMLYCSITVPHYSKTISTVLFIGAMFHCPIKVVSCLIIMHYSSTPTPYSIIMVIIYGLLFHQNLPLLH